MPPEITRLAPSPTGALHLGNARTFLVNWALARWSGVEAESMTAAEFATAFDPGKMPRHAVVFTREDDELLRRKTVSRPA